MSVFQLDLGNAILRKLEETHKDAGKKKTQGPSRISKKTDRNKSGHPRPEADKRTKAEPRGKLGPEKEKSKAKQFNGPPEKNRKPNATSPNAGPDQAKPVKSAIGSQSHSLGGEKSSQSNDQDVEQENGSSDEKIPDDRELLLEEIKKLGGTEEDLELITFSASEEEEVQEDCQVDPTLVADLKDFMKGLDFQTVIGMMDEKDRESPKSLSTSPNKTRSHKSTDVPQKRKKLPAANTTEPSPKTSSTHPKREKKKKKSNKPG